MTRAQGLKNSFAGSFTALGLDRIMGSLQRAALGPRHVRLINYHATPPEHAGVFESHCRLFASRFVSASPRDLLTLLRSGNWAHTLPGVALSFDDGLRSNYDIAAPILERHGLRGWFFVPAAFPDIPAAEQREYARQHRIASTPAHLYPDARVCMSWEELRSLADRGHVVGSHTMTHQRLRADVPVDRLREEIIGSREHMEARMGRGCESFCWVGGEKESYSRAAAELVRRAGYSFSFMTCSYPAAFGTDPLQLQRTNIESPWPLALAKVHVSGLTDLRYWRKRRWVNRLTGA